MGDEDQADKLLLRGHIAKGKLHIDKSRGWVGGLGNAATSITFSLTRPGDIPHRIAIQTMCSMPVPKIGDEDGDEKNPRRKIRAFVPPGAAVWETIRPSTSPPRQSRLGDQDRYDKQQDRSG